MKKSFFFLLLLFSSAHSQINELHTSENIKKFADYLFAERDYLRSIIEYERLSVNDTIQFKIALAYQVMGKYNTALQKFSGIGSGSSLYKESQNEYAKTLFLAEKYEEINSREIINSGEEFQRLHYLSFLFTGKELPGKQYFLKPFPTDEQERLINFYNYKKNPPYKNSLLAGLLSSIIPGSGKIYAGEIGDGLTSFITTSLLAFLSYDNFFHGHKFRGWIFAGLGFFFYAGNIYGSAAAANIYNAELDHQFNSNLKEYLNSKNYFIPENDFIK